MLRLYKPRARRGRKKATIKRTREENGVTIKRADADAIQKGPQRLAKGDK